MNAFWPWVLFVLFACLAFVPLWLIVRVKEDVFIEWAFGVIAYFVVSAGLFCLWNVIMSFTIGMTPEYGRGEIQGYINHTEVVGVIWKTNEGEMTIDNSKQAQLTTFRFSVPDEALKKKVDSLLGTRIKITYRQWWTMPYRLGATNIEAVKVESVP